MIVQVEPVKIGDEHWIGVTIDGSEMERRGPFPSADVARQLLRFSRALSGGKHG
jgi:hypothetical protein